MECLLYNRYFGAIAQAWGMEQKAGGEHKKRVELMAASWVAATVLTFFKSSKCKCLEEHPQEFDHLAASWAQRWKKAVTPLRAHLNSAAESSKADREKEARAVAKANAARHEAKKDLGRERCARLSGVVPLFCLRCHFYAQWKTGVGRRGRCKS